MSKVAEMPCKQLEVSSILTTSTRKTRGYGLMGCRDLGKVEVGVRFPLAPPMSRSSNKTGIPEDTALSGGDEGENPSLLSMTECRWEYSLQS